MKQYNGHSVYVNLPCRYPLPVVHLDAALLAGRALTFVPCGGTCLLTSKPTIIVLIVYHMTIVASDLGGLKTFLTIVISCNLSTPGSFL